MYSKIIFSILILFLLTSTKINGYVANNYTGKCNDIYVYLEGQGKIENFNDCKMNDEGEVTELFIYAYCLNNTQLETLLSYNTIETLEFTIYIDENYLITDSDDIASQFGCSSIPTNYELLNTLTNLKYLDLTGAMNSDLNVITSIPKSVEILKIGENFTLTQKMVDVISNLTNLNSLTLLEIDFNKKLDFSKFTNLKNLTSLEFLCDGDSNIPENIFKNFAYLKKLYIYIDVLFDKKIIDRIGDLTNLEELEMKVPTDTETNLSFISKLKNLYSLSITCDYGWHYDELIIPSSALFSLTNLKRFSIEDCGAAISTSRKDTLTWANLKNLEYLNLINVDHKWPIEFFDFNYLGDLPSLKEVYIWSFGYSSLPESIGNLKNLEILDLTNNSLETVPNSIVNLENLRELYLEGNVVKSLPDKIGNLKNLEVLDLSYNDITSLPNSIENLVNLEMLYAKGNGIINIPKSIGKLSKLEYLDFYGNNIVEIPKFITNLNITELNFDYNSIEKIPDEIGNMKYLVAVSLCGNQITEIPSSIGNLKNLEVFLISSNKITSLPKSISNLEKLKQLDLNFNKINALPDEIGNLKNLEELIFNNNEIINLPETMENLVNLKILVGDDNKIVNIPTNIRNLSKLEDLDLSYNEIVEIPKSIGNLKLERLTLNNNNIERIPDEMGNMENLKNLFLSYNNISNIPSSFGNLKKLNVLVLKNNLIDDELPESLNDLPSLKYIDFSNNINIKGKTLNNKNLNTCIYYPPKEGYTYSLCESVNAYCKDKSELIEQCVV